MLANSPFIPSLNVTLSTTNWVTVNTSLLFKVAAVCTAKWLSLPTHPLNTKLGAAWVLPSYTLVKVFTLAVKGAGSMLADTPVMAATV